MPVLTSRLLREPSVAGFPTLTGIPLCSPHIHFAASCGCQFSKRSPRPQVWLGGAVNHRPRMKKSRVKIEHCLESTDDWSVREREHFMDKRAIAEYKASDMGDKSITKVARPQRHEDPWARNTSPRASASPCGYGKGNLRTHSPRRRPRRIMKRRAMSSQAEPNYISKARSWTWNRATLGSCRKVLATATKSWKRSRRWRPPPRPQKCTAGRKASRPAEPRPFWLAPWPSQKSTATRHFLIFS